MDMDNSVVISERRGWVEVDKGISVINSNEKKHNKKVLKIK